MVPVLDDRRKPTGMFRRTLADTKLAPFDNDLTITLMGQTIPVWRFIERYLRVKPKKGGHLDVFEINEAQCDMYIELCLMRRNGKPPRIDILKARQLGFSTFIAALIFTLTVLVPNQTACIVADKAEHASVLFKKYKLYYNCLPAALKQRMPTVASNAKELIVDYGDGEYSTVRVVTADDNAGRSDTAQYLHFSETAFWKDIEGTTTAMLQVVDDTNIDSMVFYETTANGVNDYKTIWDADWSGTESQFKALFYPWYMDKGYREPYTGFELFEWERKMVDELHLDMEQIAWYRSKYRAMRGNLNKLRQEFPSTPVEAFIVSGASVFNMEQVLKRKAEIMAKPDNGVIRGGEFSYVLSSSTDGKSISLNSRKFVDTEFNRYIHVFEEPKPGHPYVVNFDPSAQGEDYYAIQVIDNSNGRQVARYKRNRVDCDTVTYQVYCLVRWYNDALLSGETNTPTGTMILKTIRNKLGYRKIYQDNDVETLTLRYDDRLGYKTTQKNRNMMIESLAERFRDDPNCVNDYDTIVEMENFQYVNRDKNDSSKVKAMATGGFHDDLVMALCGAELSRGSQIHLITKAYSANDGNSIELLEEAVERKNRERSRSSSSRTMRNMFQVWN